MSKAKVLVVDDEPGMREILRDDLLAEGYDVVTAESGRKALELLAKEKISLIISDVRMPDGDGVFLAKEVKRLYPLIPFMVLITGFSDLTAESATALGVRDLLPKPYDIDKLLETARQLIEESRALMQDPA